MSGGVYSGYSDFWLQPFAITTVVCKLLLWKSYAIYCTQADRVIIAWLCNFPHCTVAKNQGGTMKMKSNQFHPSSPKTRAPCKPPLSVSLTVLLPAAHPLLNDRAQPILIPWSALFHLLYVVRSASSAAGEAISGCKLVECFECPNDFPLILLQCGSSFRCLRFCMARYLFCLLPEQLRRNVWKIRSSNSCRNIFLPQSTGLD